LLSNINCKLDIDLKKKVYKSIQILTNSFERYKSMVQIIVLAAVAFFLFWRLKSVLGSRQGFEKLDKNANKKTETAKTNMNSDDKIIDLKSTDVDEEIADYVDENSEQFKILSELKKLEEGWQVSHFVSGAKLAYEEILMAFENSDLNKIKKLSSKEVYTAFKDVIDDRNQKGLQVEAMFGGVRDIRIKDVKLNKKNLEANITMIFQCDITYTIKDKNNKIIEGGPDKVKKQKDIWTFTRKMNSDIPNWFLTKTE
jgi:predicted lipid-binding transport protein (Tim44 family)